MTIDHDKLMQQVDDYVATQNERLFAPLGLMLVHPRYRHQVVELSLWLTSHARATGNQFLEIRVLPEKTQP